MERLNDERSVQTRIAFGAVATAILGCSRPWQSRQRNNEGSHLARSVEHRTVRRNPHYPSHVDVRRASNEDSFAEHHLSTVTRSSKARKVKATQLVARRGAVGRGREA